MLCTMQHVNETSDLGVAAALCTIGYTLDELDRTDPRRVVFRFCGNPKDIERDIQAFWTGRLKLPPAVLLNNHKLLKQRRAQIFELAQASRKLYEEKATKAEKRQLFNFVFSDVLLIDNKLIPKYKNGFQLIAERAKSGDWLNRRNLRQPRGDF